MLIRDDDPVDVCGGHGTHVAGIIAADARNISAPQPFVGVAPGAILYMYRIFGCEGDAADDVVIDAMSRAFVDGMDVISMSIGEPIGWSEGPQTVVANRIAARGVPTSVAAGNGGHDGLFLSEEPASGTDICAVASVNNLAIFAPVALTAQNRSIVLRRRKCKC